MVRRFVGNAVSFTAVNSGDLGIGSRTGTQRSRIGDVAFRSPDSGHSLRLEEIVPGQLVRIVTGSGVSSQLFTASV